MSDSFVVGLGNTQKDMLSNQLQQKYGLDVYNLSHPADITGYCRYVRGFLRKYGGDFKVFMFIYEGNIFPEKYTVRKEKKPITSIIGRRLRDLVYRYRSQITRITRTHLYRLTYVEYLFIKKPMTWPPRPWWKTCAATRSPILRSRAPRGLQG